MDYTIEQKRLIIEDVCRMLADGASFRQICSDPHMPNRIAVRQWIRASPEFQAMVRHAEQERASDLAEELLAIVDGEGDPADKRVRMDARRWLAARMHSAKFGDKVALVGADDGPVKVAHSVDLAKLSDDELLKLATETECDGSKS